MERADNHTYSQAPAVNGGDDKGQDKQAPALRLECLDSCGLCNRPEPAGKKSKAAAPQALIYTSPRVGMCLTKATSTSHHKEFYAAPYRFGSGGGRIF